MSVCTVSIERARVMESVLSAADDDVRTSRPVPKQRAVRKPQKVVLCVAAVQDDDQMNYGHRGSTVISATPHASLTRRYALIYSSSEERQRRTYERFVEHDRPRPTPAAYPLNLVT